MTTKRTTRTRATRPTTPSAIFRDMGRLRRDIARLERECPAALPVLHGVIRAMLRGTARGAQ